ncbi:MAG TPA: hypothetical protein VIJ35_01030 [Bradyrhizobium sp.]
MKRPLALSDRQLRFVRAAASAAPLAQRDQFLRDLAKHLAGEPSDESVMAAINVVLDRNLTPMFLTDSAPTKGTTP